MTPTIITADSLARAAEAHIVASSSEPLRTISFHRPEGWGRSASARRARESLAAFERAEPRSHLLAESPRSMTWRFSRARYEGLGESGRAEGTSSRAGGHVRRTAREAEAPVIAAEPGLSLDYRVDPGVGRSADLVGTSDPGLVSMDTMRERSRSARSHLRQAYRLVLRSRGRGIGAERRRELVLSASEHCRQAFELRDWVDSHRSSFRGAAGE